MTRKEKWDRIKDLNERMSVLDTAWKKLNKEKQELLMTESEPDRFPGESDGVPIAKFTP